MTKTEAYEVLSSRRQHWCRLDTRTIRVYMSSDGNGSHHEGLDHIKDFLEQAGLIEWNRDFDPICGKGFSDFKEPKDE